MALNNTGNAVPSTNVLDFVDNVQVLDQLINSDSLETQGRLGQSLKGIQYLQNILTSLNLGDTYPDTETGLAATTEGEYFRVPQGADGDTAFIYYRNVSGTATIVAETPGASAIKTGNDVTNAKDISDITSGVVINLDGTTQTSSAWNLYYVPVQKGDIVTLSGPTGSLTSGESMVYLSQMDSSKNFVSVISSITSIGDAAVQRTLTGTATEDGYIAARMRVSTIGTTSLSRARPSLVPWATYDGNAREIDAGDDAGTFSVAGLVMNSDGSLNQSAGTGWVGYFILASKGTTVTLTNNLGSNTAGESILYIAQLDDDLNLVSALSEADSSGSIAMDTVSGTATQDGVIYVRYRVGTAGASLSITRQRFAEGQNVESSWVEDDFTDQANYYHNNEVMYSGGSVVSGTTYNAWRMYYIPVKKGDVVSSYGQVGSSKAGEVIAYLMQLDSAQKWVADVTSYTSLGSSGITNTTLSGVAVSDGYMAVRVRVGITGVSYSVIRRYDNSIVDAEALREAIDDVTATQSAEVFNAPYHMDLSGLPETNPDFSGFSSPLNYTFRKQWARRDFYNAAVSYMLSHMDLSNNPWNSQSNIYDLVTGGVFTNTWQ